MSFGKKLSRIFNRTVTHGAFIAASLIGSGAIGYEVADHLDGVQSTQAIVASADAHQAALEKINRMSDEIIRFEGQIQFTASALEHAKANIGTNGGKISEQLADVQAGFTRNEMAQQVQMTRIADFRREILFNPALSEKEASDIYDALWYKSNSSELRNFFSPFEDALAYRDETIAALKLPHNPAAVTFKDAEAVVTAARAADDASDSLEWKMGVASGIGSLAGLFGLSFLGATRKRREEAEPRQPNRKPDDKNTIRVVLKNAP